MWQRVYKGPKKSWLDSDVWVLKLLSHERFTGKAMATVMGRTTSSIYAMRSKLKKAGEDLPSLWDERNDVVEARRVVRRQRGAVHRNRRSMRVVA